MSFLAIYARGGLAIWAIMTLVWLLSLWLKNTSIVDIFWGSGFVLANWIYVALAPGDFVGRKVVLSALVTIWGLRLSLYILWRNWGEPEDYRYRQWREEHGDRWWWYSYFQTFILQGLLMWIISTPLLAVHHAPVPSRLTLLDWLGVVVWSMGFFFEAVGDFQMARFKADPSNKGKVLDSGVWRYTRHPNYFGDAAQWWGYYLMAAAAGAYWTIYSPVLMTILLLRVSGVALLEKKLTETKPKYQDYIRRTSAFVPWFPKPKEGDTEEGR
jgi:steroid 5-alpha reductase family enzyme